MREPSRETAKSTKPKMLPPGVPHPAPSLGAPPSGSPGSPGSPSWVFLHLCRSTNCDASSPERRPYMVNEQLRGHSLSSPSLPAD